MGFEAARKAHLQELGLPSEAEMIRRARAFLLRSGLTIQEMAEMAAVNQSSLRVFLTGNYNLKTGKESGSLGIRAQLKECMDRQELANFATPQTTHYATQEYAAIRKAMLAALKRSTAYIVDGPPGTQKTYTFRRVADEINASGKARAVYVYSRFNHAPQSFLTEICTLAGIPSRGSIDQLIRKLRFFLGGQTMLLIVDEAQHLGTGTLETLRQLLDTPPYFGVVLGGSHDISRRVVRWEMEQWRSRVRDTHKLTGLTKAEAAGILAAELGELAPGDVAAIVKNVTVSSRRDGAEFRYISARNLFFAIEDAKAALHEGEDPEGAAAAGTAPAPQPESLKEALA